MPNTNHATTGGYIIHIMIPSNPNPPMTREEVNNFHREMARRMRGEFTPQERERFSRAKSTYEAILKSNGGKNPILGY